MTSELPGRFWVPPSPLVGIFPWLPGHSELRADQARLQPAGSTMGMLAAVSHPRHLASASSSPPGLHQSSAACCGPVPDRLNPDHHGGFRSQAFTRECLWAGGQRCRSGVWKAYGAAPRPLLSLSSGLFQASLQPAATATAVSTTYCSGQSHGTLA